jgi:NTP pyrophosphatase (non-canonical NTP hydrolase)
MLKEYVEFTEQTCAKLENKQLDNLHMVLGMVTETGELADVFKKNLAYNKEMDWVNIKEEVGDLCFYIASFCRINNLDWEEILETNMKKLKSRYPEKFSQERAINRNLGAERKILEQVTIAAQGNTGVGCTTESINLDEAVKNQVVILNSKVEFLGGDEIDENFIEDDVLPAPSKSDERKYEW